MASGEETPGDLTKYLEENTKCYKGITMFNNCLHEMEEIQKMEIKEDDIWVCSFPRSGTPGKLSQVPPAEVPIKSCDRHLELPVTVQKMTTNGTTLTQELVYLIQTLDFERAKSVPLDERFPFVEFLKPEMPYFGGIKMIEALPSPRFIKSHLHHFLLPEQLMDGRGKIIYTARNVRDALWSTYSLINWLHVGDGNFKFDDYFEKFLAGKVGGTPWSLHVRQFWEQRNTGNILFLQFEETVKDMPRAVEKIATFLNRTLTPEDVKKICEHCSLVNMKENVMLNLEYLKKYRKLNNSHGNFINTGKGGSWREHFTDEMNKQVDEMIKKDFAGSDITFYNP